MRNTRSRLFIPSPGHSSADDRLAASWRGLITITILAAYAYVFMEWLFLVTKPSYLNMLGYWERFQVLVVVGSLTAVICLLALIVLYAISLLPPFCSYRVVCVKVGAFLPTFILATLLLLMVDNFTYTVFKFGIVSTQGLARGLYGVGFLLAGWRCYWFIQNLINQFECSAWAGGRGKGFFYFVFASVLLVSIFPLLQEKTVSVDFHRVSARGNSRFPNVLLITSDGVNATNMSVYGYDRDTTPRIRSLGKDALVAENAFANSGATAGSVISIYTGKYPARTRVVFPPDQLKSEDALEHLPGILKAYGYYTVQIAVPHYLDATSLNVLDAFNEVSASDAAHTRYLNAISHYIPNNYALFADEIFKRIFDRLRHIFFIKTMVNPFQQVNGMPQPSVEMEKMEHLKQILRDAHQPVFAHVHLMGTHGPYLNPSVKHFSRDVALEKQPAWSVDFYDDSILEFDTYIGDLIDTLSELNILDNTILVIGSDHGQKWDQLRRVPLIIRFPHNEHAGRILTNVQNLDIAPTILDYIDLDQPDWMQGASLISGVLPQRPIIGVYSVAQELNPQEGFVVNWDQVKPPFYQFGNITVIYCRYWYKLNLIDQSWESGEVVGSTTICPLQPGDPDPQAFQWVYQHLQENGFDVTTLDPKYHTH